MIVMMFLVVFFCVAVLVILLHVHVEVDSVFTVFIVMIVANDVEGYRRALVTFQLFYIME